MIPRGWKNIKIKEVILPLTTVNPTKEPTKNHGILNQQKEYLKYMLKN